MDSKLASLKANVELSDLLVVCGLSLAGALVWDHKYNDGRFWREIKSSFESAVSLQDGEKSENSNGASLKSSKSINSLYVNPASNEDKLPASDKLETKNSDEYEKKVEDCANNEMEAKTEDTEEQLPNFDASLVENLILEGNATAGQIEEDCDASDANDQVKGDKPVSTNKENSQQDDVEPNTEPAENDSKQNQRKKPKKNKKSKKKRNSAGKR